MARNPGNDQSFDNLPSISNILLRQSPAEFLRSDAFLAMQKKVFQPIVEVVQTLPGLKDPPSLSRPVDDVDKNKLAKPAVARSPSMAKIPSSVQRSCDSSASLISPSPVDSKEGSLVNSPVRNGSSKRGLLVLNESAKLRNKESLLKWRDKAHNHKDVGEGQGSPGNAKSPSGRSSKKMASGSQVQNVSILSRGIKSVGSQLSSKGVMETRGVGGDADDKFERTSSGEKMKAKIKETMLLTRLGQKPLKKSKEATWDIASNKKNWMRGGGFGAGGAKGNMGVKREESVAKEDEVEEEEEEVAEAEPDEEQIQSIKVSKSKAWLRGSSIRSIFSGNDSSVGHNDDNASQRFSLQGLTAMTPHNMDRGEMKNLLAKVRQWEGPTASRRASMASIAASAEGERRVSVSKNPTGNMANMASTKSIFSIAASAASLASGFSDAPKDHGAAPGARRNQRYLGAKKHVKVYRLTMECKNLRGSSITSQLDTRVVVAQAEEYISKKGKWWWKIIGETEYAVNTSSPVFIRTVDAEFDPSPGTKHPMRFDVYARDKFFVGRAAAKEEHLGHFVCDLKDIINAETTHGGRILSKANEGVDDASFLQFDVVRILRDSTTPREMFEAFFKADTDKTRCLDFHDFREVVSKLAAGQGQKVSHEGIRLAFSMGEDGEKNVIRYDEFISMVYFKQGTIRILGQLANVKTPEEEAQSVFQQYKKDTSEQHKSNGEMADATSASMSDAKQGAGAVDVVDASSSTKARALEMASEFERRVLQRIQDVRFEHMYQYMPLDEVPDVRAVTGVSNDVEEASSDRMLGGIREQVTRYIRRGDHVFRTCWSQHHKGMGVLLSGGEDNEETAFASGATCNMLNENSAPCGVRTAEPIPDSGVTYFEVTITRPSDEVQLGESLDGPYAIGLCTANVRKFDVDWLRDGMPNESLWLMAVISPLPFLSTWSTRWKAPLLHVGDQSKGLQVTYTGRDANDENLKTTTFGRKIEKDDDDEDKNVGVDTAKYDMMSIRSDQNLPMGTSYFEVTIRSLGKAKGDSLGGNCYIGVCSGKMQNGGSFAGDWTQNRVKKECAWVLNDSCAGQMSMKTLGTDESMSERDVQKRLRAVFDSFDADMSGTLDFSELHKAMKVLDVFSTDQELKDILETMDTSGDGTLDFDEFVMMMRSRAATGRLFHGEARDWALNSFFGAGDTIGVLVDTSKKSASFFKNNVFLGQAFSDLPDLLYPFVTLSRPGMTATLSMPSGKSMSSRSEIVTPGARRQWVDSSAFGCGDRIGFAVDMDERSVTVYKNGQLLGKPFDNLPDVVYPVVSLRHTGSCALLSFPPQPNPNFVEQINMYLGQENAAVDQVEVPEIGGVINLAGGVDAGGITLSVPQGDGGRLFMMRAADCDSTYDLQVLGWGTACLVSPVLEVTQIYGPSLNVPAVLEMSHCCEKHEHLVLAYMPPMLQPGSLQTHASPHQNVWKALEAFELTDKTAKAPIFAGGFFCVISLGSHGLKDIVHIEYEFDVSEHGDSTLMYPLASLQGHRVPKFGAMQIGERLTGRVKICTRSSVDPAFRSCKEAVTAKIVRGHLFLPVESSAVKGNAFTDQAHGRTAFASQAPRRRSVMSQAASNVDGVKGGAKGSNRQWIGNPTDGRMRGQTEEEDLEVVAFSDSAPLVLQHAALRMFCDYPCDSDHNTAWKGMGVSLELVLASEVMRHSEVVEDYLWGQKEHAAGQDDDDWEHALFRFVGSTGQLFRIAAAKDGIPKTASMQSMLSTSSRHHGHDKTHPGDGHSSLATMDHSAHPASESMSRGPSVANVVPILNLNQVRVLNRATDFSSVVPYRIVLESVDAHGHVTRTVLATGSRENRDQWMFVLQSWQSTRQSEKCPTRQQASIHLNVRTASNIWDEGGDNMVEVELAPFFICILDHQIKKLQKYDAPVSLQPGRSSVLLEDRLQSHSESESQGAAWGTEVSAASARDSAGGGSRKLSELLSEV